MAAVNSYSYDWNGNIDKEILKDLNWFLYKINERACIQNGFIQTEYKPINRHGNEEYGLFESVEYFHPSITLDDRMRYICEYIIPNNNLSDFSKFGNTVISHFYGARGVHQVITGSNKKDDCFINFDEVSNNNLKYIDDLRNISEYNNKILKKPVWGRTELHTSIQTAARNFCRKKYNDLSRKFYIFDVVEWVASFKNSGIYDKLLQSDHIKDSFGVLLTERGIGDYYGFHCSASTSVLPFLKYHHDQRFVAPGPGAQYALSLIWPQAPRNLYAEGIYFLRENSDLIGLTDNVEFHEKSWNINDVFLEPQNTLKYYGTEVLCCQFGIYQKIKNDKFLSEKRKVARLEENDSLCLL